MKKIYLDNAAEMQIIPWAKDKLMKDIEELCNPNSTHDLGARNKAKIEQVRKDFAAYIGAEPHQIIFTPNSSAATALAFNGFKVTCGGFEHPNVLSNVPFTFDEEQVELYSHSLVNGEDGEIYNLKEIFKQHGGKNKLFHSDLTAALPTLRIDVNEFGVDFASFSGTKIGALSGTGVLYTKNKELLLPLVEGSKNQEYGFGGTQNTLSIISLGYAIDFLAAHRENYAKWCIELKDRLITSMKEADIDFKVLDKGYSVPNVCLVAFRNISNAALQTILSMDKIYVGLGVACHGEGYNLSPTVKSYNLPISYQKGLIRFSFGYDTSVEDIDKTVMKIKEFVDA